MATESVKGINPDILKWARERSGYTVADIAQSLSRDVSIVNEWESGERLLTYAQLEELADKYKRPIAIFFFPEPPEEPDIPENLAARRSGNEAFGPNIRILLRQALARQLSLMELNMNTNPSEKKIFRDLHAQPTQSAKTLAAQVRDYLAVTVDRQTNWKGPREALENWRDCIQETGIFVFKAAFKDDAVDGFCLMHDEFPVIYLNNSTPTVRQIFTLFHELGHLLRGESNITSGISSESSGIEEFCNQFAAEFLVPSDSLQMHLNYRVYNNNVIKELANHYKVSRPVILLKLVGEGIFTQKDYWEKVEQWDKNYQDKKDKSGDTASGGGSYYNTQAAYLGYKFMELAFGKYRQGHCSVEELADHLNVKVKALPNLEDCLLKKALR